LPRNCGWGLERALRHRPSSTRNGHRRLPGKCLIGQRGFSASWLRWSCPRAS
jgi:hypothetical protein